MRQFPTGLAWLIAMMIRGTGWFIWWGWRRWIPPDDHH